MRTWLGAGLALAAMLVVEPEARACGGFFCSQSPVDQSSERILFAVGPGPMTTMIVQIAYSGGDADFSWVLPLGSVPDAESLEVFPQMAVTSLDSNTGPLFMMPEECWQFSPVDAAAGGGSSSGGPPSEDDVTVHVRAEVGPYDVAVVESEDHTALVNWLRTNNYRITDAMEPYIQVYTEEGMKFLALKLLPGADVSMIQPLKLTLPGETPLIPIRLSAIASEPEMGILAFVFGDQRYEPANWPSLAIADDEIAYDPWNLWSSNGTNWTSLVARKVDEAGGQGFVTEYAGPTQPFLERIQNSPVNDEEQQAARDALLNLMEGRPYMTRLYSRLSPEEMRTDPMFRRSTRGDVPRERQLSRYVDGRDMCTSGGQTPVTNPCDFVACGAGGTCALDAAGNAGCACVDNATARAISSPQGGRTVTCQDSRMSFVNPGEPDEATGQPLADPCLGTSCGEHGRCVAVNMTPTCTCDRGFIAVVAGATGSPSCTEPATPIPSDFYDRTLPDPANPGRDSVLPPPPGRSADITSCACALPGGGSVPFSVMGALLFLGAFSLRRRRGGLAALLGVALVVPLLNGCGTEEVPTMKIGTGEAGYEPLTNEQDVRMVQGAQGGWHMWMSLQTTGIDPEKVWLDIETRLNGETHQSRNITKLLNGHRVDELVGWPVLIADPDEADGQRLELSVTLTDQHGESVAGAVAVRLRKGTA